MVMMMKKMIPGTTDWATRNEEVVEMTNIMYTPDMAFSGLWLCRYQRLFIKHSKT